MNTVVKMLSVAICCAGAAEVPAMGRAGMAAVGKRSGHF